MWRSVRSPGAALWCSCWSAWPLAFLVVYFARHVRTPGMWIPVGLIVGGALGNLADRAREGRVIDFIDPIAWPAFNVADIAVVVGRIRPLLRGRGPAPRWSPFPAAGRRREP